MSHPTTAQRLIDFRNELSDSGRGFGEDLLNDLVTTAAHLIIDANGLTTRLDLPSEAAAPSPDSPEGVGESESPA
ncbi:hypothetical protein LZP81_30855 [Streptomyces parvulus]|uniref:hypothetical protein n=1 Tax=Streptomyces parvulus TaxID=146923 RepID=UPI001E5B9C0D|nr:hypothetical protein [Streptomyces parvulus]MCC9154894.1 hypothetical protein [Streptomyces parvulus]MCE7691261.1 hypothetical protein [Streptomyces parvulus]